VESVDTTRDLLAGVLETYLSQTSNRMNRVMKQLSVVATVALPLIVIAGIYGMNFSRMPLIHDALGFWVAVASMAASLPGDRVVVETPQMALKLAADVLTLKTKHPFVIARGATTTHGWCGCASRTAMGGGVGEADPSRYYGETADTVLAMLRRLEPHLPTDPFNLDGGRSEVRAGRPKNGAARAALSAALHDLVGKRLGQPVWRLWGLDPARAPRSSFTIGLDTPEKIRQKVLEGVS